MWQAVPGRCIIPGLAVVSLPGHFTLWTRIMIISCWNPLSGIGNPNGNCGRMIYPRTFRRKNQLFVYIPGQERQLTPEELTDIWKSTEQIVAAYTAQSVEKTVVFSLPAPIQVYNSAMQSYDTVMGWISFSDFTEAEKEAYFSKYADYWKAAEETQ